MLLKKTKFFIFISLLIISGCSYVSSTIIKFNDLPDPDGSYTIGTRVYTWIDELRDETFTENPLDKRKIVIQIWYPINRKIVQKSYYLDNSEKRIDPISKQLNIPSFLITGMKNIKTNSELNAKIDFDKNSRYPLIIFSHGLGGMKVQNTIQIEKLVSQGYIVIAPDHSYDANITIFDNDDIAEYRSSKHNDHEYSLEDFYSYRIPQIQIRSADISFIIDEINRLQLVSEETIWQLINLDRIGIFGHSFGGGTGIVNTYNNNNIDVCVALDGWVKPVPDEIINSGIKKPFLYIGQTEWEDTLNYYKLNKLIDNSTPNSSKILLSGTKHLDYTDTPHLNNITKTIGVSGDMPTHSIIDTLNYHLVTFFNKHLKDI